MLHGLLRGVLGGLTRCERGALPRPFESDHAGAAPGQHIPVWIGDCHQRVIEGRLNVCVSTRNLLALAPPRPCASPSVRQPVSSAALLLRRRPSSPGYRSSRPSPRACVRARPLSSDRQPTPMAQATVAADFHQALDVEVDLASQVSLHGKVSIDVVSQARDLIFRQLLDPSLRVQPHSRSSVLRPGSADPIDVRQRDLHLLIVGNVYASNTSQSVLPAHEIAR